MRKNYLELKQSSSEEQVTTTSSSKIHHVSYNKDAPGEVIPVQIPPGVTNYILDYLDLEPISNKDQKSEKPSSTKNNITFFGKHHNELIHRGAALVGNLILHGEEKDVEAALRLIKENPDLLRYQTIAIDHLGRQVQGTVLQIAAMAGDVDVIDGITEEKEHGMVERIVSLGYLSKEEVMEQLQCITSDEAKKINEERNQRVVAAIKKFGQGLIESKEESDFEHYQTSCKSLIEQLEKDLQPDTKKIITKGYVFDPKIIRDAIEWFEANVDKGLEGSLSNKSDVYCTNCIGMLQSKLSSRDAQLVRAGIGYLLRDRTIPPRLLSTKNGYSYFLNSASGLGRNFYLGYLGCTVRWWILEVMSAWKTYVKHKQEYCNTFANLCSAKRTCQIM